MTNEEKAQEICEKNKRFKVECSSLECYLSAMEMAKWKDEQLWLLIDSIDHAYLQTDGTHGNLSLEVVDKIEYLKNKIYSK